MTETMNDPPAPLGSVVTRGLGFSFLSQVVTRIAIFGSGVVLARLLSPADFGFYALALLVVAVLGAVNELGVIPAIVRWRGDVRTAAGTGVVMATVNSVALFLAAWLAAPWFAALMDSPEAIGVIRLVAFTLVVDGLSSASQALLHRDIAQGRQALAETIGSVAYVAVAVSLAAGGEGAESIGWGRVVGSLVTGALFVWLAPFVPRPSFHPAVAKEMLAFGLPLAGSALVAEAILNVDYLVVGKALGAAALGFYLLAFNLSNWPVSIISMSVQRVAFAGFVRIVEDKQALSGTFARAFGVALTGVIPMVVILAVLSPELVSVVYGKEWLPAVVAVRFLLVLGGLRVLMDLLFDLCAADGRSGLTLLIRLVWFVVLCPMLWWAVHLDGLRGAGIAHVAVAVVVVVPMLLYAARRSGIHLNDLSRQLARPLTAGFASLVVMVTVNRFVEGDIRRLLILGSLGAAVYVLVLVPANPLVAWTLQQVGLTKRTGE
jgi:PST family polysaccharide transporter